MLNPEGETPDRRARFRATSSPRGKTGAGRAPVPLLTGHSLPLQRRLGLELRAPRGSPIRRFVTAAQRPAVRVWSVARRDQAARARVCDNTVRVTLMASRSPSVS